MVKAKLIIDGKEINVLWFTFGFNQGADRIGRPSQRPVFVGLKLIIETRKDLNLADWSFSPNQTKQLELHIYPVIMGGKTRKLYFYDCHLVNWGNNFNAIGKDPMTETLEITCAGVKDSNSMAEYSAYWRETFDRKGSNQHTPTIIDYEKSKDVDIKLTKITYTDGTEISEYFAGDIIEIHFETKNSIGKTIDLNLNDNEYDFKYEGKLLKNDILKNYKVKNNKERITLEVIKTKKK